MRFPIYSVKKSFIFWVCQTLAFFLYVSLSAQLTEPKKKEQYIVVVTYPESHYSTTGEYFICQESNLTAGELNDMIRRSVLKTMVGNLSDYYKTKGLSHWNNEQVADFNSFEKLIKYKEFNSRLSNFYKGYPPRKINQWFAPKSKKWGTDCVNSFESKPNTKTHTYTKASVTNDSLFKNFAETQNAAYFLLVNKFEMKTRFKNCVDMSRNVFQRDFFLHYSLIDAAGKQIDGGVVGTTYQSKSNNANAILEENMGVLAGLVIDMVRRKLD